MKGLKGTGASPAGVFGLAAPRVKPVTVAVPKAKKFNVEPRLTAGRVAPIVRERAKAGIF